jgi:NitT/TauT family transport system permease protein
MIFTMQGKKGYLVPIKVWAVLFWLVVWQLGSMQLGKDILLVSPLKVLLRLGELIPTAVFWKSVAFSFIRIASGFLLAAFVGSLTALLSAKFLWIRELLAPLLLTVKSVPVASFIILALIWFSSKSLSVLISFLMVLPVIYTNTLSGILSVDKSLWEMAKVFRLSQGRKFRYIDLPQILPYFYSGCEVGLGLCWKSGVAAEVIGMPTGSIGERLQQSKVYLNTPDLFAWTVVIVVISCLFERFFLTLIKKAAKALERM